MKNLTQIFLVLFLLSSTGIAAQQKVFTLEEVIAIGLQNNFGIKVANNMAEIARVNKSAGVAGMLPSIEARGSWEQEELKSYIHSTPREVTTQESELFRGELSLNWTVFDGLKMFTNYKILSAYQALGETEARIFVENMVTQILITYYNIVQQQKRMVVLENSLEISQERLNIAETKFNLGSGSEYEVLMARTDLNADRSALLREQVRLNASRARLMQLLNLEGDLAFEVTSHITIEEAFNPGQLFEESRRNNPELQALRLKEHIATQERKTHYQDILPRIALTAGLDSRLSPQTGNLQYDTGRDMLYVGVTARLNIFNGFERHRNARISRIHQENTQYRKEEATQNLMHTLQAEYTNLQLTRELIELETDNLRLAEQSLEMALERFRLADITSIELRETQRTLLDTETRLISSSFEAKIYETELLRLSGRLGEKYGF